MEWGWSVSILPAAESSWNDLSLGDSGINSDEGVKVSKCSPSSELQQSSVGRLEQKGSGSVGFVWTLAVLNPEVLRAAPLCSCQFVTAGESEERFEVSVHVRVGSALVQTQNTKVLRSQKLQIFSSHRTVQKS